MKLERLGLLLSLGVLIACALPVGAQPSPGMDRGTRVAIANPSRIFHDMKETVALRDKLELRRKELLNKEIERRQVIEGLMKQRSEIKPDHPRFRELSDAIDAAKADLQAWGVATKASVDRDQKYMVKTLYDKIETAIGEVAQQNNIDLVISDGRQEVDSVEEMTPEELRRVLGMRNVLFSTKAVDLSEKVITVLDAKFAAEKKQ